MRPYADLPARDIAEAILAGNPLTRYGPTLPGLPASFVDIGSVETFRDEDVDYATRLLQAGVQCELHVWPRGSWPLVDNR